MTNKMLLEFRKTGLMISPEEMLIDEIVNVFLKLMCSVLGSEEEKRLSAEFNSLCDFFLGTNEKASLCLIAQKLSQKSRISYKRALRGIWGARHQK